MDVFNDSGLTWYVTNETTRRRFLKDTLQDTLQESLLDQVVYTNDALVNGCKIVSPLGKSDHVGILVELVVSPDTNKYCDVVRHVRTRIRFAMLRTTLIALRGYRGKKINIKHEAPLSEVSYNLIPAPVME